MGIAASTHEVAAPTPAPEPASAPAPEPAPAPAPEPAPEPALENDVMTESSETKSKEIKTSVFAAEKKQVSFASKSTPLVSEKSKETNDEATYKKSALATKSSVMTFEEQKKARAARFGIAVVANKQGKSNNKRIAAKQSSDKEERAPKEKKQKSLKKSTEAAPEYVLPEDEILRRIKRAEKFGITKNLDTLKAQLRKHRFSS